MADRQRLPDFRSNPFLLVIMAALALVLVRAVIDGRAMHENFATMDNDDILRLVMVRDLIAGQGWFDTTQYRLLPPDGVALHWSRYIDLGVAAIIVPLSRLMPMDTAEQLAVTIWPTLVFIIHVLVVAYGTRRVFGTLPACFAIGIVVIWPVTGQLHSGAGNIDHHNIQMLMMTIVAFTLIWPVQNVMTGIIGGVAAALSLAVGLETLPFIAVAGGIALTRYLVDGSRDRRVFLIAFCLSLATAAALLWWGQTAPALRGIARCDQLGLPALSLIGVAVTASVLATAMSRFGAFAGLAVAVSVTAVGIALIWPVLAPCLDGPYGNLSPELQTFISTQITEARPAHLVARDNPVVFTVLSLPVVIVVISGTVLVLRRGPQPAPIVVLWVLCLLGLAILFYQVRTVIMAAAVVPVLGGVVIARAFGIYLQTRAAGAAVVWLGLATTIMGPTLIAQQVQAVTQNGADTQAGAAVKHCRDYDALRALNTIPPDVFITPIGLGPAVLWATHHSVVSAGYHVNSTIMANSLLPFQLPEQEAVAFLRQSGASFWLMCRGVKYDSTFATALASGSKVDWLRTVPIPSDDFLVFEILPR